MSRHKDSRKSKLKRWIRNNKFLFIITVIVLTLILVVFAVKIYLYLNFLLGNDILIKLEADKEYLSLIREEKEKISFEAKVTTNPFCSANCEYKFEDISKNTTIEHDSFALGAGRSLIKEYVITADQLGEGQELYRFNIKCKSKTTAFCQTKGKPASRSILITVNYNLTEEEEKLKNEMKEQLEQLKRKLEESQGKNDMLWNATEKLDKNIIADIFKAEINNTKEIITKNTERLTELKKIWDKQDYYLLKKEFKDFNNTIIKTEDFINKLETDLSAFVSSHNYIVEQFNRTKNILDELRSMFLVNINNALEINKTINDFNARVKLSTQRDELLQKEEIIKNISNTTNKLYERIIDNIKKEVLNKSIEIDINYDVLCRLNQTCLSRPSIAERAYQDNFDLKILCDDIEQLKEFYIAVNETLANKNPETEEFWDSVMFKLIGIKQNITNEYLERLPKNGTNSELIITLLNEKNFSKAEKQYEASLISAIITELIKEQPESCSKVNISISKIEEVSIEKVNLSKVIPVELEIEFKEPLPQCCIFGKCRDCCVSDECRNNITMYPVLFLHGYAINKDVVAYGADAFNKIQEGLEKDDYLNAGSISLYTLRDKKEGVWSLLWVPVSIKASYYFDVFQEPQNYILIQTKSENIDTYAIRLKEIIDAVQLQTKKPKVNIIAHSMGGLIARRYLQIFGSEKVDKLVLLGTPNKGISGNIADYCSIGGGKLECRDMNSNSLLINKLNREELADVELYNIIATGCQMSEGIGDGVVLEKNANLEGSRNFLINGTCKGIDVLHTEFLDIDKYPETYAIIKKALS